MFAIAGIAFSKMLPANKSLKILGVPNRLVYAMIGSIFCVIVELLLNAAGALTWDYTWWNVGAPWLIFLIGYLPFFLVSFWVFDLPSVKQKAMAASGILGFDLVCLVLFASVLNWI